LATISLVLQDTAAAFAIAPHFAFVSIFKPLSRRKHSWRSTSLRPNRVYLRTADAALYECGAALRCSQCILLEPLQY